MGEDHLSISPANDVLLQMCLEYIDRDLRRGNGTGQEGHAGLRAVRQADHPRPGRLLRGAGARSRRRRGQRTGRGQRRRASSPRTVGRSTSTSSSTPPATTWTSCPPWTSAAATAGSWPTSGATAPRLPWRHRARIPEPVHHLGTQLQPRPRCGRQLLDGGDGALRHRVPAADGAARCHRRWRSREQAYDDYVRGIDEAMSGTVWCHTPERAHLLPLRIGPRRGRHPVPARRRVAVSTARRSKSISSLR